MCVCVCVCVCVRERERDNCTVVFNLDYLNPLLGRIHHTKTICLAVKSSLPRIFMVYA